MAGRTRRQGVHPEWERRSERAAAGVPWAGVGTLARLWLGEMPDRPAAAIGHIKDGAGAGTVRGSASSSEGVLLHCRSPTASRFRCSPSLPSSGAESPPPVPEVFGGTLHAREGGGECVSRAWRCESELQPQAAYRVLRGVLEGRAGAVCTQRTTAAHPASRHGALPHDPKGSARASVAAGGAYAVACGGARASCCCKLLGGMDEGPRGCRMHATHRGRTNG